MRRHVVALAVVLAGLAPTMPPATAADPVRPELPRTACTKRILDPDNDAGVEYVNAATKSATASVPGLDIQELHLRTTADQLQVFLKLKDIPTTAELRDQDTAFVYTVTFKYATKTFTFGVQHRNPDHGTFFPTNQGSYPVANTGSGVANSLKGEGFSANIWPDVEWVAFLVPRARVETALGQPLNAGEAVDTITALTEHYTVDQRYKADALAQTGDAAKWTIGDEFCFGAAPGTLSDLVAPAATFGDPVTLSAKLVNEQGAVQPDKPVDFTIAGEPARLRGTTNADGVATVKYVPTLKAGSYAVTAAFPGDATVGKVSLAGTITVKAETTKFLALAVAKPTTTTRTVTATLLDNDNVKLAGQKVDWYVNGKKVSTVVTGSTGKSVYKGAKPGQTVQAKFAGVAGKYLGTASVAKKV